jgi:hypothetical protein
LPLEQAHSTTGSDLLLLLLLLLHSARQHLRDHTMPYTIHHTPYTIHAHKMRGLASEGCLLLRCVCARVLVG